MARPHPRESDRESLHEAMRAQGHEIVHEVVAGRHGAENLGHPGGLFLGFYPLIAEVDGAVACVLIVGGGGGRHGGLVSLNRGEV